MANGGFFRTKEEWQRIEAPLVAIDPLVNVFAAKHYLIVTKNRRDNPDRTILWNRDPGINCLIQLWLVEDQHLLFNLWICASQDRSRKRYWKNEMLINGKTIPEFKDALPDHLEDAYAKLQSWSVHELEFATDLPRLED